MIKDRIKYFSQMLTERRARISAKKSLIRTNELSGIIQEQNHKKMVYCVDGSPFNPGLCDKLRGILSTYYMSKKLGFEFKIAWCYPFDLENYLVPHHYEWRINQYELLSDERYVSTFTLDFWGGKFSRVMDYVNFKDHLYNKYFTEYHTYNNIIVGKRHFAKLYDELFQPSNELKFELERHKENLGERYISVSLRFMELLGDFKDQEGVSQPLSEEKQKDLMQRCYNKLCKLIDTIPVDYKVFVATDSFRFLTLASKHPRVYTVPGEIVHIRYKGTDNAYMKTFVDLMLLKGARTQYLIKIDGMYNSGFPRFASWIGRGDFRLVQ